MPGFKTHLIGGNLAGASLAAMGMMSHDLTTVQAGAVWVLGATGGLIPDIDSDTGKPLALMFQWLSVLIPVLVYPYIRPLYGSDTAFMLCYFPLFYLMLHYVACPVVKKLTRHRGMMHSVPFAVISAEAAYLLLAGSGPMMAFYGGLSMFAGCMVHLVLDECQSMDLKFGFIVILKRSSGNALKFTGNTPGVTVMTYLVLCLFTLALVMTVSPGFHDRIMAFF